MKKEQKLNNINTYLIVALILVVAVGLYFTLSVPTAKKAEAQTVPARELQLTLVGSCDGCYNLTIAVDFIKKQQGINVTDVKEVSMADGSELIAKYNISRLPALIVTGNTENFTIPNFESKEDALIFAQAPAPYYDVAQKRIRGNIEMTVLKDSTCAKCFDMSLVVGQLKQAGVKLASEKTIDSTSAEGKALIAKYKIEKVPTIIFNDEALVYDVISQVWSQVGTTETDGSLVLRYITPPYINTSTNKLEGLVDATYLMDSSCADCFNASVYSSLIGQSFNMVFSKEETIDVNSTKGKLLIKKYNITAVPIVILSKEAGAYPSLAQGWTQVGTQEKDGNFVFRNVALLEGYFQQTGDKFAYKDLATGEVKLGTAATEEAEITTPETE